MWGILLLKILNKSHPHNALSAVKVRNLSTPGRYGDGNGLYLVVDPSGAKRWLLRTVVQGRKRDMGLGGVQLVSLAEARELARTYRRIARDGGDPIAERRSQKAVSLTFEDSARQVHQEYGPSWKNPKHRQQWINTLRDYAFPGIGTHPVSRIDAADVLRVLQPIWLTKPETAKRVRQRLNTVFEWAIASGHRTLPNPVAGVAKALPKQTAKAKHQAALAYGEVPAFVRSLRDDESAPIATRCLEFTILTACRTGEVIQAKWNEVDLGAAIWSIPRERMKAGREHRVPLSTRACSILYAQQDVRFSDFVFPGAKPDSSMSNMAMLMYIKRRGLSFTVHGFRSSFRDWTAEQTAFPHDVCEMALAHTIPNKAEAAYRRGDLLEKRRDLMASWADYLERTQ